MEDNITISKDRFESLTKPYILKLEKAVAELGHGVIELRIEIRSGQVAKMVFTEHKNWLPDKEVEEK